MSLKQHTRGLERKRQRDLVAVRGKIQLDAMHATVERQPDGSVRNARYGIVGDPVHLYTFQRRRGGIDRQR